MIPRFVRSLFLFLGVGVVGAPTPALALSCDFTVSDLSFGFYDIVGTTPTDSTASLTVTCERAKKDPAQVKYDVSLGASTSGSMNPRALQGPNPDPLFYNIFTDATRLVVWGDGTGGTSVVTGHIRPIKQNDTGSLTHIFYGRIFPLQPVLPGSYADSITLTIDF
jgi:spore coat protein U-like protein